MMMDDKQKGFTTDDILRIGNADEFIEIARSICSSFGRLTIAVDAIRRYSYLKEWSMMLDKIKWVNLYTASHRDDQMLQLACNEVVSYMENSFEMWSKCGRGEHVDTVIIKADKEIKRAILNVSSTCGYQGKRVANALFVIAKEGELVSVRTQLERIEESICED